MIANRVRRRHPEQLEFSRTATWLQGIFLHPPILRFRPLLKYILRNMRNMNDFLIWSYISLVSSRSKCENRGEPWPRVTLLGASWRWSASVPHKQEMLCFVCDVFRMSCCQEKTVEHEQKHVRTAGNGRATAATLTSSQGHVSPANINLWPTLVPPANSYFAHFCWLRGWFTADCSSTTENPIKAAP